MRYTQLPTATSGRRLGRPPARGSRSQMAGPLVSGLPTEIPEEPCFVRLPKTSASWELVDFTLYNGLHQRTSARTAGDPWRVR